MKTSLLKELKQRNVITTAYILKIIRTDGKSFCMTTHYEDIVFENETYLSNQSFDLSAIVKKASLAVNNAEITAILNSKDDRLSTFSKSIFKEADLKAGIWSFASYTLKEVNYYDLSKYENLLAGRLGGYKISRSEVTIELRDFSQVYHEKRNIIYTPICRASFCDKVCLGKRTNTEAENFKNQYIFNGSVTALNNQQSWIDTSLNQTNSQVVVAITGISKATKAVITAQNHNLNSGESVVFSGVGGKEFSKLNGREYIISRLSANTFSINVDSKDYTEDFANNDAKATVPVVSEYFKYGLVEWTSGNNAGLVCDIQSYRPNFVELFMPLVFEISVGDTYIIKAGCDGIARTCLERFNNKVNFDAEEFLPGVDNLAGNIS